MESKNTNQTNFRISIIRFRKSFNQVNIGYPKIDLWISKNRFMDIQKSNYGYPKIHMI